MLMGFTSSVSTQSKVFQKKGAIFNYPTALKYNYWPPELKDNFNNQKIDVWCLGVLLYLMITGHYPFEVDS